jgi:hypothetical protein
VWQVILAAVPATVFQDISLPRSARPDISPAHLPEDPLRHEAEQAAAAAAAQQQQEQQQPGAQQ